METDALDTTALLDLLEQYTPPNMRITETPEAPPARPAQPVARPDTPPVTYGPRPGMDFAPASAETLPPPKLGRYVNIWA
jgi:hypothetical protein